MASRSERVAAVPIFGLTVAVAAALGLLLGIGLRDSRRRPADDTVDLRAEMSALVAAQANHGYLAAEAGERAAFAKGVAALLRGDTDRADRAFQRIDYRVRVRTDVAGGRFAEAYDVTGGARGWGRVLLDLRAGPRLAVEIPHPGADRDTELLGVAVLRRTPGAMLLVAGAHRRATSEADVAHAESSAFESAHEEAVAAGLPVVQLHGFAQESAVGQDVVVSAGPSLHGVLAIRAADLVERAGFAVCRAWVTGCPGLEGTTNVQARHGGDFAHVEVAPGPRQNAADFDRLAAALSLLANASGVKHDG